MTVRRFGLASLVLLACWLPAVAAAQGLGDTAAREREKRAKQAGEEGRAGPVFTNDDLDAGRPARARPRRRAHRRRPGAERPAEAPAPPPPRGPPAAERPYIESAPARRRRGSRRSRRGSRSSRAKLNPMSASFIYGAVGQQQRERGS